MLGVVILNYLNYSDTIECIQSLQKQTVQVPIVVVDNKSPNESVRELKRFIKPINNISLIVAKKNVGYARGNNLGIKYLRNKIGVSEVLLCNNDVLFDDNHYIQYLNDFDFNENTGAAGTRIIGNDGSNQNPTTGILKPMDLIMSLVKDFVVSFFGLFAGDKLTNKIQGISRKRKMGIDEDTNPRILESDVFLHGSAILLTHNFFSKYDELFPKTFLFFEENILSIMLKKCGLNMVYLPEVTVLHKEDQSTKISFSDTTREKRRYMHQSKKIALKILLMSQNHISQSTVRYYKHHVNEDIYDVY